MQGNGTNSLRKLRKDWWKSKICTSCVSPLGRIISRGGICPQCGLRVCKDCRSETQPGSGAWVCVLCSNGGISPDIFGKTKSLGRDSCSIRRSWTISTPHRAQTNSPVLKSYTIIQPEESLGIGGTSSFNTTGSGQVVGSVGESEHGPSNESNSHRQFHSLPRMSSGTERSKKAKRSFNQDFEKENIKRHRSFQSTLHPYQAPTPPSPSASINFIEDPFWDYYDYDIEESSPSGSPRSPSHSRNPRFRSLISGGTGGSASILQRRNSIRHKLESDMDRLLKLNLRSHSNRSSCERSLGETYDYDYSKNYSYSNYNSLSDTELNDNSKYDQEDYRQQTFSPKRFSTESTNFYKFATVTPVNMSPMSDTRKETSSSSNSSNRNTTNNFNTPSTSTPVKPERKCNRNKRSFSLNSYDGKKLFSPLRTYVIVMKENVVPRPINISDASITNANVNANSNSIITTSSSALTAENNSSSNKKVKNQQDFTNNTSSILINANSASLKDSEFLLNNSPTKFHSLPRERVIRIEREDGKFARSNEKHSQNSSLSSTTSAGEKRRNVSKVEITRSISSASAKDFQPIAGNVTKLPIEKSGRRISRSQSHREISLVNKPTIIGYEQGANHHRGQNEVPSSYSFSGVNLRSRSTPSPNSTSTTRLNGNESAIRAKGDVKSASTTLTSLNQKPLLSSLLDDRDNAAVMENFLRSPSQNISPSPNPTPSRVSGESVPSCGGPTNEKCSKKSDFVQSQMSDFENFQRTQIETFDNYLRQCSTFPRALQKQKHNLKSQQDTEQDNITSKNSKQRFEPEPKSGRIRHTSTTLITHDDNFVKSWDNLDEYFQPIGASRRLRARSEVQLDKAYDYPSTSKSTMDGNSYNTVGPIVGMKQSDQTVSSGGAVAGIGPTPPPGWSATLPHPYVRKHKQQKSFFIAQQQMPPTTVTVDDAFSKEKTRISNVEQDIERDIYFQKTKSLDRARPARSKTSIFDTNFEKTKVEPLKPFQNPPVASPRLKRKAKLLPTSSQDISLGSNVNVPKINAEQAHAVNGTGTNYPKTKNNTRLPNEPRPTRDLNTLITGVNISRGVGSSTSHSQSQSDNANNFILENQSQFANTTLTNSNSQFNKLSGTKFGFTDSHKPTSSSDQAESKMKMNPNTNHKSNKDLVQQVVVAQHQISEDVTLPAPIATPRTRRKNSNPNNRDGLGTEEVSHNNFHDFNNTEHYGTMDGDSLDGITNGRLQSQPSSSANNNLPKAVRFELHIIEMEENERKHNKGVSSSSSRTNNANVINTNGNSSMRMNNNNFNNKLRAHLGTFDADDDNITSTTNVDIHHVPISSPQFASDYDYKPTNSLPSTNSSFTKSASYPYNYYNTSKSVYSFHPPTGVSDKSLKSIKKPHHRGFVARAIAKVKSKAKLKKGKNNGNKTNLINSNTKLRSIETRDSIVYISPPPTQQKQYQNQSTSVIQEITLNPISSLSSLSSAGNNVAKNDYKDGQLHNINSSSTTTTHQNSSIVRDPATARSESFTKAGILKNTTEHRVNSPPPPGDRNNSSFSGKSPPKPKRSSLKTTPKPKDHHMEPIENKEVDVGGPLPPVLPSLSTDQLTPSSSSSSSSSSYLSNIHESYEFFHASEECESIDEEENQVAEVESESDQNILFKSFDDDEDAGEDFIFYSQTDDSLDNSRKTKGISTIHAYPHQHQMKQNHNQMNQIISNNQQHDEHKNYREILLGSSATKSQTQPKDIPFNKTNTTTTTSTGDVPTKQKGLILGNNGQVAVNQHRHRLQNHHHHNSLPSYVESRKSSELKSKGVADDCTTPLRNSTTRLTDPPLPLAVPLMPQATSTSTIQHFINQTSGSSSSGNRNNNNNQRIKSDIGENFNSFGEIRLNFPPLLNDPKYQSQPSRNQSYFHSSQNEEEKDFLEYNPQHSHLLLSSLDKSQSGSLPSRGKINFKHLSESEFFPGAEQQDVVGEEVEDGRGMSSLPQNHKITTSTTSNKFKSSVLVNNPQGGEEYISIKPPSSPEIPAIPRTGGLGKARLGGSKNVTTVEISGDVGIVNSTAASAFLSQRIANLKKVNQSLWKNDVYSSGLSQLRQHQERREEEEDDDHERDRSRVHSSIRNTAGAVADQLAGEEDSEIGSSVGGGGSGSSDSASTPQRKSVSSSISEDGEGGSSDYHSESTKNTVIFRPVGGGRDVTAASSSPNRASFSSSSESLQNLSPSSGEGGPVFNYNCDPEIHISSIDLVDNNEIYEEPGSRVAPETGNCVKASTTIIKAKSAKNLCSNKALDDKRRIDNNDNSRRKADTKIVNPLNNSGDDDIGDCDTFTKGRQGVNNVNGCISSSTEPQLDYSSKELTKSELVLTELDDHGHLPSSGEPLVQIPEDELEMVQCNLENDKTLCEESKSSNSKNSPRAVPATKTKSTAFQPRRESPEGQEQEVPGIHPDDKVVENGKKVELKKSLRLGEVVIMENPQKNSSTKVLRKSEISQNALSRITASSRSSPDGADADRSDSTTTTEPETDSPTPMIEHFDVTSDEDSWVEEIIFEDDDTEIQMCKKAQPPLDLTLHTIVEESCEEFSDAESGNFNSSQKVGHQKKRLIKSQQNDNELEKYFNFGINTGDNGSMGGRHSFTNEDSEFSDTFSESSFSLQDDHDEGSLVGTNSNSNGRKQRTSVEMDPAELASSRLEKYFYNLGLPQLMINPISSINQTADSDSVGSESESDNSVLENRKKVLKHHRRSADFEDEFGDKVSDEEDDFGFGQDGLDTIKKTGRKGGKKGSDTNLMEGTTTTSGFSKISENSLSSSCNSPSRPTVLNESSNRTAKSPLEKTFSNGTSSSKDDSSSTSPTSPPTAKKSSPIGGDREKARPLIKVNRSNSFQWSSDEEVNIMMSKLRQLIRNLVKSKTESGKSSGAGTSGGATASSSQATGDKDKQLAYYLEGELIRLMKTENLKNIVEYFSSEESDADDVYKFIKVVKESSSNADDNSDFGEIDLEDPDLLQTLHSTIQSDSAHVSPKGSPALLAKVMNHIGNRLAVWMKDENIQDDDNNDDNVTLKCAQSVSSDLNEDRFSWKGSFESALAAKRQSVGSTDSISSSDFTQDRSILRSSSLHHLCSNSAHHLGQVEEHKEEEDTTSSLPRMTTLCNSLPRLNQPSNLSISRAHSLVMSGKADEDSPSTPSGPIKSARYRPPGFQPVKSKRIDDDGKNNPILSQSTPMLTQDVGLKVRSDSVNSIFHDTKPHIPVKGQVEFGLQYNYKLACLEVQVKQCRELAAVDTKRNRSDPYVKAYLLPDRSKSAKRKTKIKKNTLNPAFDETLKFPLTLSDLQNRTLWLSVWHSDIFGKNEFLGEVLVDLKDRVFDDPNPKFWDLQEMSGQTEDIPRGDVVIALKWQPKTDSTAGERSEKLSVLVKEAKNLAPVRNGGSPSSFIKCSLLSDKSRKHKTSICRRSYNPVWNQTLTFEDAGAEGLEITLWNHDLLSNNDLLGKILLEYDHPLWKTMLSRHAFWVEGILRLN